MIKNLPANAGDIRDSGSIPGSGGSPGGGNSNAIQYCCLKNPRDRGAGGATGRIAVGHDRVLNIFCFCGESCSSLLGHSFFFFGFLHDYWDLSEATFRVALLFITQMPPKFGQVCESHSQALKLSELSFLTH